MGTTAVVLPVRAAALPPSGGKDGAAAGRGGLVLPALSRGCRSCSSAGRRPRQGSASGLPACLPACLSVCWSFSWGCFLYVWGFLFRHPPLGLGCCLSLSSSFMGFGVFCACFSTRPGKAQEALKKCPRGCGTAAAGRGPEVARTRGRRGGFAGRPLRTLPSAGAGRRRSPARAGASSGGVPSGSRSGDSLGPGGEGRRGRLGEWARGSGGGLRERRQTAGLRLGPLLCAASCYGPAYVTQFALCRNKKLYSLGPSENGQCVSRTQRPNSCEVTQFFAENHAFLLFKLKWAGTGNVIIWIWEHPPLRTTELIAFGCFIWCVQDVYKIPSFFCWC